MPGTQVHLVLHAPEKTIQYDSLNSWCQLHFSQLRPEDGGKSLLDLVRQSTVTTSDAEAVLVRLVDAFRCSQIMTLAGSTVQTDLQYIKHQMPALYSRLHYQVIDVTTLMNIAIRRYRSIRMEFPRKTVTHCAMDDIRSSHMLYKWLIGRCFVPVVPLDTQGSAIPRRGPRELVEDRLPPQMEQRMPAVIRVDKGTFDFSPRWRRKDHIREDKPRELNDTGAARAPCTLEPNAGEQDRKPYPHEVDPMISYTMMCAAWNQARENVRRMNAGCNQRNQRHPPATSLTSRPQSRKKRMNRKR